MLLLLRVGPFALLTAVAVGLSSVGAPLLMGLVAVAWIGALRRFLLANSSPVPDPSRARRLLVALTLGMQWFLAILFGLSAVPQRGPGLVIAGAGIGCLLVPAALIVTYAGKPPPPEAALPAPPDGWLLVPREDGTGYSVRWRHPRSWQAVAILAAGPLAIILVGLVP